MNKLLYIVGPTATGKTAYALQFAKEKHGVIINADSRQVYIGMDIGTGKDLPTDPDAPLFLLYNVIKPNESWSLSHAVHTIRSAVEETWKQGKLPIVVGGTGLYLQSIEHPPASLDVPQNTKLREKLEKKSVEELQQILLNLDEKRFTAMNPSDQKNPRRLIRAVEIASQTSQIKALPSFVADSQWIGLTAPVQTLQERIIKRVETRLEQGMEQEVHTLMTQYSNWDHLPAFTATGYQEVRAYIEKKIDRNTMIQLWNLHELQYAKRQITWFKQMKQIEWINIDFSSIPVKNLLQ